MTPEEAIELAKAATFHEGWSWPEPIRALRCQAGLSRPSWFWEVFSSPGSDCWMTHVKIDEATRQVRGIGRSFIVASTREKSD